jgi:hypothetical protein
MNMKLLKHRSLNRIAVTLVLDILSVGLVQSQTGVSYTPSAIGVGARAAALSEAYTADTYDVTSMYWNPAALSFLQKSFVVMNHFQELDQNAMSENVAIPLLRSTNALAIGASVSHLGYIKDSPQGTRFRFIEYGFDIAYARVLTRSLSLGVHIGTGYGRTGTDHLQVASSSFGLVYSPYPWISYGLAYSGVGWKIRYSYDTTSTSLHRENPQRSLQIAITMRYPQSLLKPSIFTLSAANERDFRENALRYKGAIEACPVGFLALRFGYQFGPSRAAASYGVGLRFERFQLDYAISPSRQYDRFQQLCLSIAFWD